MLRRPGGVPPRFSVIIAVCDREDVVGRAVAGVLAQTFADVEVVVVDDGSTDDSVAAARAVADHRVRIVRQERAGIAAARTSGLDRATGDWVLVLDPDDEVAAGWLARLGRLIDSTGAALISCGGEHRHLDGSTTEVLPSAVGPAGMRATASFRTGAFTTTRERLREVGGFGGPGDTTALTGLGLRLLGSVGDDGGRVTHTPEVMVRWNEQDVGPVPEGDALRLRWALQGLEAVARTPIPDGDMLTRYATVGGVAAARLRDRREARRLLLLARRAQPEVLKHWARWMVACLPPLSDRIWLPGGEDLAPTDEETVGATAGTDQDQLDQHSLDQHFLDQQLLDQQLLDQHRVARQGLEDVADDVVVVGPLQVGDGGAGMAPAATALTPTGEEPGAAPTAPSDDHR